MVPLYVSFAIGLLWGITNVLLNCFKVPVVLLLNQAGSLLYYVNLRDASFASHVPLCNTFSLVVSALIAHIFFNENLGLKGFLGISLVSIGIFFCQTGSA